MRVAGIREARGGQHEVIERTAQVIARLLLDRRRKRDHRRVRRAGPDQQLGLPGETNGPVAGHLDRERGLELRAGERGTPEPVPRDTPGRDHPDALAPRRERREIDGARGLGEHPDGELPAQGRVRDQHVVDAVERDGRVLQVSGEHVAEQVRALEPVEMERLVALLHHRLVRDLVETEDGLGPRLYRVLEELAEVRDRQAARGRGRGRRGGSLDDPERGAQRGLRRMRE